MRKTALSPRLHGLLQMMTPCRILADVGTDHAHLPAAALSLGIAQRAVASDLRVAPLQRARATVEHHGLEDRITLRRGNGLQALAGENCDAVVMAGMSGSLMVRLCIQAPDVLAPVTQLLVQPNVEAPLFRSWAYHNGWHVIREQMVPHRGRFYSTSAYAPGSGQDPAYAVAEWTLDALFVVGPLLLSTRDPVAARFYAQQCARLAALEHKAPDVKAERVLWERAAADATPWSAGPKTQHG